MPPSAGEDDVFFAGADEHPTIRFVAWEKPKDFQRKLLDVLVDELKLDGLHDTRGFNREMGATTNGNYDYFNSTRNGTLGAVQKVEAWQIMQVCYVACPLELEISIVKFTSIGHYLS